jgi:hypothetical protein
LAWWAAEEMPLWRLLYRSLVGDFTAIRCLSINGWYAGRFQRVDATL